jgi:hypothetical protein
MICLSTRFALKMSISMFLSLVPILQIRYDLLRSVIITGLHGPIHVLPSIVRKGHLWVCCLSRACILKLAGQKNVTLDTGNSSLVGALFYFSMPCRSDEEAVNSPDDPDLTTPTKAKNDIIACSLNTISVDE